MSDWIAKEYPKHVEETPNKMFELNADILAQLVAAHSSGLENANPYEGDLLLGKYLFGIVEQYLNPKLTSNEFAEDLINMINFINDHD